MSALLTITAFSNCPAKTISSEIPSVTTPCALALWSQTLTETPSRPASSVKEPLSSSRDALIHGENHDLVILYRGRGGEPQDVTEVLVRIH